MVASFRSFLLRWLLSSERWLVLQRLSMISYTIHINIIIYPYIFMLNRLNGTLDSTFCRSACLWGARTGHLCGRGSATSYRGLPAQPQRRATLGGGSSGQVTKYLARHPFGENRVLFSTATLKPLREKCLLYWLDCSHTFTFPLVGGRSQAEILFGAAV